MKDDNKRFVRISRLDAELDLVQSVGCWSRRVRMIGHDGSVYTFIIQNPSMRACRREERLYQLFTLLNK